MLLEYLENYHFIFLIKIKLIYVPSIPEYYFYKSNLLLLKLFISIVLIDIKIY